MGQIQMTIHVHPVIGVQHDQTMVIRMIIMEIIIVIIMKKYHVLMGQIEVTIHPAISVEHVFVAKVFCPVVVVDWLKMILIMTINIFA